MKSEDIKLKDLKQKEVNDSNLQKLYVERIEKFFALVELSYALKHAPRIRKTK